MPIVHRDFLAGKRRRSLGLLPGFLAKQGLNLGVIPPLISEGIEGRLGIGVD